MPPSIPGSSSPSVSLLLFLLPLRQRSRSLCSGTASDGSRRWGNLRLVLQMQSLRHGFLCQWLLEDEGLKGEWWKQDGAEEPSGMEVSVTLGSSGAWIQHRVDPASVQQADAAPWRGLWAAVCCCQWKLTAGGGGAHSPERKAGQGTKRRLPGRPLRKNLLWKGNKPVLSFLFHPWQEGEKLCPSLPKPWSFLLFLRGRCSSCWRGWTLHAGVGLSLGSCAH